MEIQPISNSAGGGYSPPAASTADLKQPPAAEVVKPAQTPVSVPTDAVQAVSVMPKPDEIRNSVNKINNTIQSFSRDLEFSVDESTGMSVVKVVDTRTKEVIRQIPSEEVLAIAKALDKLQGLLLKDEA